MSLGTLGSFASAAATAALSVGIGIGASGLISSAAALQKVYVEQPVVELAASPTVTYVDGAAPDPRVIAILPAPLPAAPAAAAALEASGGVPAPTPPPPTTKLSGG